VRSNSSTGFTRCGDQNAAQAVRVTTPTER
jgi:hypothetical protein